MKPNESSVPDKLPAPPKMPGLQRDSERGDTIPDSPQSWREVVSAFRAMEQRFDEQAQELRELRKIVTDVANTVMELAKTAREDHETLRILLVEHEANHRGLRRISAGRDGVG